jgi:uncharacterized repeat protein (TIGR03847 family)
VLTELDPVDRITAGAVGEPGSRTFYLQARKDDEVVTILVEKQQVQLLAASVVEILARVGKETGQGPPEEEMELDEPLMPEWRAGRLSIGYQEDRDLLMLEAEELVPGEEDGDADDEPDQPGGLAVFGPELTLGEGEEEAAFAETEEVEEAEDPFEPHPDARRVRFWASREQMLSLARHGTMVCAAGRPLCPLCRNPMDPEGHRCPALNGHQDVGTR